MSIMATSRRFMIVCALAMGSAHASDSASVSAASTIGPLDIAHAKTQAGTVAQEFIQGDSTVNNPAADVTDRDAQTNPEIIALGEGKLVAAFVDSGSSVGGGNHGVGYAWSKDYGRTWNDAGVLPTSTVGDAGKPALAYNRATGVVYLAAMGDGANAIQVFRSPDHGHSFTSPVNAAPGIPSGVALYNQRIGVDNFTGPGNGAVYLCFSAHRTIVLTRSTTGGTQFAPQRGPPLSTGDHGSCYITVSPNHQVSVYYSRVGPSNKNELFVRRSTNYGASFLPEVRVAQLQNTGEPEYVTPQAAVLPTPVAGSYPPIYPIYVVYSDTAPPPSVSKRDVYYTVSLDNGATWSQPVPYNDVTAGDQDCASISALENSRGRLMFGYCAKIDVWDGVVHAQQRGRIGVVGADGKITDIKPGFQLTPNTPNVSTLAIASDARQFFGIWSDDRSGNTFHKHQFDVRLARVTFPLSTTDLSLKVRAPATMSLARVSTFTVTATATGGTATDVFVHFPRVAGLSIRSISAADGRCSMIEGAGSCALDKIPGGTSKTIIVSVMAIQAPATRSFSASATTTSAESDPSNNSIANSVTVINDGSAVAGIYSTGSLYTTVWGGNSRNFVVSAPSGPIADIFVQVSLHSSDYDPGAVFFHLVSPTGQTFSLVPQSSYVTYYGSGSCGSGALTLVDTAAKSIFEFGAVYSIEGSVRPPQSLMSTFAGMPSGGNWILSVSVADSGSGFYQHYAEVFCFAVGILRGR